ncbi:MAG: sugar transferase [Desulfamplus sp.]|nr:sugar transferase [Desulfamplus sp.]
MLREITPVISRVRRVTDILITVFSFVAAYFIKRQWLPEDFRGLATEPNYYLLLMMIIIIWHLCFMASGVYGSYRRYSLNRILWQYFKAVCYGMLVLFLVMYLLRLPHVSRLMISIFVMLNLGLLFLEKAVVFMILRRYRSRGYNFRNVLILGGGTSAKEIIQAVRDESWSGYRVMGCLGRFKRHVGKRVHGKIKVIGTYDDVEHMLNNHVVDELVLADNLDEIPGVQGIVEMADEMGIHVHILPQWKIRELGINPKVGMLKYETFLGVPALGIDNTPEYRSEIVLKSAIDYGLAVVGIVLTLPVWVAAAVLIKVLSPDGPVLYKQVRLGQNGREFELYKFRTMVPDAEDRLEELREANECDGPVFKIKDDPRIIPYIGKFLRKTGLDELPQFINVLRGELSMVGPRPPLPSEVKCYERWERRRLSMKPGITCYWQIQPNRNDICFKEWMKLDLKYIDNWSLWVDTKIIFRTVWVMLTGSGR